MTLTFSPADALFLEHKVHNSSSSLHLCTRKIIGHSELCKMARLCDQPTLKVVFTVYPRCCIHKPATILPQKLNWTSMTRQYCHNQNFYAPVIDSRAPTTFLRQDPAWKIEFRTILCLRYTLPPSPPFRELTYGLLYGQ